MNILLDAFGGDNAPDEIIKGAVSAISQTKATITLVGDENIIKKRIKELFGKDSLEEISDRLKSLHSTEIITNYDKPTTAIRQKTDSSLVVGLKALKKDEGDVFISAGSTGAVLTGGLLIIGKVKGIERPVIVADVPSENQRLLIADAGANIKCKPTNLVQFAYMTQIYAQSVLKIKKPRVGLLNIGVEETKGKDSIKETYQLLKEEKNINFVGNVEAREAFTGVVDIVVCDGFDGNIFLKTVEGLGSLMTKTLLEDFAKEDKDILAKVNKFNKKFDYKEYASPMLLGINKPVLKIHGNSDAKPVCEAILNAENFVNSKYTEKLIESFSEE